MLRPYGLDWLDRARGQMTPHECHGRADRCAANAAAATDQAVSLEFLLLSAKWRAMACRGISLRISPDGVAPPAALI
jgi:hypothetical protein